jgi:hypothetical protein
VQDGGNGNGGNPEKRREPKEARDEKRDPFSIRQPTQHFGVEENSGDHEEDGDCSGSQIGDEVSRRSYPNLDFDEVQPDEHVMNDDREGEIAPQAVYTTDPPGRIGNPYEAQAMDDAGKQQRA